MTPDPPDWRTVADDPPPEWVVVETCVMDAKGDRQHLPLQRIRGRWCDVDGFLFHMIQEPTQWRPLT